MPTDTICTPDLSTRPSSLTVERWIPATPDDLFDAWVYNLDTWFAAPGSLLMQAVVNAPFFFETVHQTQRHPHYGRFLRMEAGRLIEFTWVTGAGGTEGAESVVTIDLQARDGGTLLMLTHRGFPNEASRDRHAAAWPCVLEQLESAVATAPTPPTEETDAPAERRTAAPLKYSDLEDAFLFVSSDRPGMNTATIDLGTGAIRYHSGLAGDLDDEYDETEEVGPFIEIPHKTELDLGRSLVFRFVDEALPHLADEVDAIFRRKGAYGRFKDLLAREGKLEDWHKFEDQADERALREWCAVNGIPLLDE